MRPPRRRARRARRCRPPPSRSSPCTRMTRGRAPPPVPRGRCAGGAAARARGAASPGAPSRPAALATHGFVMPRGGHARAPPAPGQAAGRACCASARARTHSMGAQANGTALCAIIKISGRPPRVHRPGRRCMPVSVELTGRRPRRRSCSSARCLAAAAAWSCCPASGSRARSAPRWPPSSSGAARPGWACACVPVSRCLAEQAPVLHAHFIIQ